MLARMEYWLEHNSNKRTGGWEKVNNGKKDGQRKHRQLKKPPPPLLDTWRIEGAFHLSLSVYAMKTMYVSPSFLTCVVVSCH